MNALRDALRDLPETVFADLLESEEAYLLVVDLPGATSETVDVTVERGRIRIEARREKAVPGEFRYLREDRALFLDAELPLPPDADGGAAEGSIDRGVLELRVPKATATGDVTVPVSGG